MGVLPASSLESFQIFQDSLASFSYVPFVQVVWLTSLQNRTEYGHVVYSYHRFNQVLYVYSIVIGDLNSHLARSLKSLQALTGVLQSVHVISGLHRCLESFQTRETVTDRGFSNQVPFLPLSISGWGSRCGWPVSLLACTARTHRQSEGRPSLLWWWLRVSSSYLCGRLVNVWLESSSSQWTWLGHVWIVTSSVFLAHYLHSLRVMNRVYRRVNGVDCDKRFGSVTLGLSELLGPT